MRFIVRILANSLAIYLAAYLIPSPGVKVNGGWKIFLLAGLILTIINLFIRPILKIISLPLIIVTLGLFSVAINIFTVWLLTKILPDLSILGFWAYFWTIIIVSATNTVFDWLTKK